MPLTDLPRRAGLGLKPQHVAEILATRPDVGFFEVHAENYMGAGGAPHRDLEAIRADYPLSIHGVALSIGGEAPLDPDHLARLRRLIDRYEPESFSEHLAWSTHEGVYLNDLLPLPYTAATLARVCDHIDAAQEALGRTLLLENPATYLVFAESEMSETDFLRAIVRRTGCGLLLDLGNVQVSATNHGYDGRAYLDAFPLYAVGEVHLAGFAEEADGGGSLLLDTHATIVPDSVWALYARLVARRGPAPSLVEWDNDVPAFATLKREADRAEAVLRCAAAVEA